MNETAKMNSYIFSSKKFQKYFSEILFSTSNYVDENTENIIEFLNSCEPCKDRTLII